MPKKRHLHKFTISRTVKLEIWLTRDLSFIVNLIIVLSIKANKTRTKQTSKNISKKNEKK